MRAVKSVSIDSARRVIITYLDGSTETLYPNCIWCDSEALRELIKDLLEEKADAITQTIENVTIATFADGADEDLIKKLLVNIEPIQKGSGDPSPENVRPISGRTGVSVVRTGIQIWDEETEYGYYSADNGEKASNISTQLCSKNYISVKPGTSYVFKKSNKLGDILFYDANKSYISALINVGPNHVFMTPENCYYIRLNLGSTYGNTYKHDISINYPANDTDYHPYSGNTYSVNWETEAGTVYGGTLDVVSGKLVVDSANIASYNGETLPPTWISDRDVYAEGTTPSTGAQVVYNLAEPVEYQLTPQEVTTLLGTNNIWADSGNILELEYTADTKLYIGEQQSASSGTLGMVNRPTVVDKQIEPVAEITDTDSEVTE